MASGFWTLLFVLAGKALCLRPRHLQVTGQDRVLVIAPHPDDETLGCGGTMLRHVMGHDHLKVLLVTDGGNSRAGGLSKDRMVRERSAEATRALAHVAPGAEVAQLALPEGRWSVADLRKPLVQAIKSFDPTIIYAPSCLDYHPEHRKVAQALATALKAVERSHLCVVRIYEVQVPLTPVLVNLISDIDESSIEKRRALSKYKTQAFSLGTQRDEGGWPMRHAIYLRMLYRTEGNIEAFWELTPDRYMAIMQRSAEQQIRVRGLRPRPFTDGLAWGMGLRVRIQIKQTKS